MVLPFVRTVEVPLRKDTLCRRPQASRPQLVNCLRRRAFAYGLLVLQFRRWQWWQCYCRRRSLRQHASGDGVPANNAASGVSRTGDVPVGGAPFDPDIGTPAHYV